MHISAADIQALRGAGFSDAVSDYPPKGRKIDVNLKSGTTMARGWTVERWQIIAWGRAMGKNHDRRDRPWRTIFAGIAVLLSTLSGIDMAAGPSKEWNQANAPSKRVQVGEVAPDFTLHAPDGSSHGLSELRGKKNLVLIFFRGTW